MDFLKWLLTQPGGVWFIPFALTGFVLLSLLLFVGELPEFMRKYFVPSLAVFEIGLGLIIFWKTLWHMRYNAKRTDAERQADLNLSEPTVRKFMWITLFWFLVFLAYNIWRGVF